MWKDLTINQKSQLMSMFLREGIDNINTMMTIYDSMPDNSDYRNGGGIHIKEENRGKFNELLERTGKSASWFKEHGTPLQKKRATFALNARKWQHADGGSLDNIFSEINNNKNTFGEGGEEPNFYDKFYNSNVGEALQWLPIVGTGMEIGNLINHPSWENLGWAGVSLLSDIYGGRVATKAAKNAAKKTLMEGIKNGGYVVRYTPHGQKLIIHDVKGTSRSDALWDKVFTTAAMSSDNAVQAWVNALGSYQNPIQLPEVVVTAKRRYKTPDLSKFGTDIPKEPVIKFPSISSFSKDQNIFAIGGQTRNSNPNRTALIGPLTDEQYYNIMGEVPTNNKPWESSDYNNNEINEDAIIEDISTENMNYIDSLSKDELTSLLANL